MFKKSTKAFTLIELLVVIAIIGILATISVLALSNARAKSRDAKRAGDMKQIQTALELFFNDNNRYPTAEEWNTGKIYSTSTGVTSTYMQIIPTAPTPADGNCTDYKNSVAYTPNSDGSAYSISFCLGNTTGTLTPGPKCLTPGGILDMDCSPIQILPCSASTVGGDTCSYQGHNYGTVVINNQTWFAENLRYDDGCSSIPWVDYTDVGWCGYYNGDEATYGDYGIIYQWSAAMNGETAEGSQGLCPLGWHVPGNGEWTALTDFLGGLSVAGGKLKEPGTEHWSSPNVTTVSSGFNAIPVPARDEEGVFSANNYSIARFWTSFSDGPSYSWSRALGGVTTNVDSYYYKHAYSYSIRCLKN